MWLSAFVVLFGRGAGCGVGPRGTGSARRRNSALQPRHKLVSGAIEDADFRDRLRAVPCYAVNRKQRALGRTAKHFGVICSGIGSQKRDLAMGVGRVLQQPFIGADLVKCLARALGTTPMLIQRSSSA